MYTVLGGHKSLSLQIVKNDQNNVCHNLGILICQCRLQESPSLSAETYFYLMSLGKRHLLSDPYVQNEQS